MLQGTLDEKAFIEQGTDADALVSDYMWPSVLFALVLTGFIKLSQNSTTANIIQLRVPL